LSRSYLQKEPLTSTLKSLERRIINRKAALLTYEGHSSCANVKDAPSFSFRRGRRRCTTSGAGGRGWFRRWISSSFNFSSARSLSRFPSFLIFRPSMSFRTFSFSSVDSRESSLCRSSCSIRGAEHEYHNIVSHLPAYLLRWCWAGSILIFADTRRWLVVLEYSLIERIERSSLFKSLSMAASLCELFVTLYSYLEVGSTWIFKVINYFLSEGFRKGSGSSAFSTSSFNNSLLVHFLLFVPHATRWSEATCTLQGEPKLRRAASGTKCLQLGTSAFAVSINKIACGKLTLF
jgi:hypothetical protein